MFVVIVVSVPVVVAVIKIVPLVLTMVALVLVLLVMPVRVVVSVPVLMPVVRVLKGEADAAKGEHEGPADGCAVKQAVQGDEGEYGRESPDEEERDKRADDLYARKADALELRHWDARH